jgi:arginase family enzyme
MKKIIFFGCSLDADERHESIEEKRWRMGSHEGPEDPYEGVMEILRRETDPEGWAELGSMELPSWLRPIPPLADAGRIHTEAFVDFVDRGGFESYAQRVGDWIADRIFPDIPCMLSVDHSLTGGAFKKLTELYKPETISLIVLDSHTDALPMSVLSGIIHYDIDSNPDTLYDRNDPFLYDRPDSYNASSFLQELLARGIIHPHHLYILGVGDYPPKSAFRSKDPRVESHVRVFSELKKKGVTLLTKQDLVISPSKAKHALGGIKTPYVYISIDMDIGARNAVEGVRFLERQGLNEAQIYQWVEALRGILSRGIRLAGMDLSEMNPRKAGQALPGDGIDRTYRIAANILKRLLLDKGRRSS